MMDLVFMRYHSPPISSFTSNNCMCVCVGGGEIPPVHVFSVQIIGLERDRKQNHDDSG